MATTPGEKTVCRHGVPGPSSRTIAASTPTCSFSTGQSGTVSAMRCLREAGVGDTDDEAEDPLSLRAGRHLVDWAAIEVSGVRLDGFHTMVSPHTSAIAQPQPGTATGKVECGDDPHHPQGCHCSTSL